MSEICCTVCKRLNNLIIRNGIMASPVKETPVLEGDDARRFVERMNETRVESADKKRRRLANYRLAMSIMVNK